MNRKKKAVDRGGQLAINLLPLIKCCEELESDEDRIHFWAGLFGTLYGMAAASIGSETVEALRTAIVPLVDQVLPNTRAH